MSRRDDDYIGHVPKITPAHDEIASYQRNQAKGSLAASIGEVPDIGVNGSGSSVLSKTLLTAVVLVLLATVLWAAYLHQKLTLAEHSIQNYELRIGDLERRLSVSDESMSESSVAIKVKVRELDSEIRKLWDNVWKKTKGQLAAQDALLKKQQRSISKSRGFIDQLKQQFTSNDSVMAGLAVQLNKAEKAQQRVNANQQKITQQQVKLELTVDKLNRQQSSLNSLNKRVKGTEEWVESINGFRRQVTRDLGGLKQDVGQLQGGAR